MAKINLLSFAVANLIAAGEVVDRPASVIKELMENSIDAGATGIMVEIQHGGATFMRVTDNGCGMTYDELPMALRRHATSKIKDASDLDSIISLGFRGEALAAISSVSKLRMISRTADSDMGAMLEAEGGKVTAHETRGAPVGTTIIIEDLFYNVPARRKFLKKDVIERSAVSTAVEKIALSHPEVRIGYISDGDLKLETSGDGKLINAIYSVYGRDFARRLLPIDTSSGGISVRGYISQPDNVKATRAMQSFFVNGRYVKSGTITAALEQAFSSYLQPERFPCAVLFIDINPMLVDVNVHPSKLEIKFSSEPTVFEAVYYAVKSVLAENVNRPELSLESGRISAADYRKLGGEGSSSMSSSSSNSSGYAERSRTAWQKPHAAKPKYDVVPAYSTEKTSVPSAVSAFKPIPDSGDKDSRPKQLSYNIGAAQAVRQAPSTEAPRSPEPAPSIESEKSEQVREIEQIQKVEPTGESEPAEFPETAASAEARASVDATEPKTPEIPFYRILGEAFNSYIFLDVGEKVLIIDKHAAHERLIFERFKRIMAGREEGSQLMLIPIEVSLGGEELEALRQYRSEVESLGLTIEIKDGTGEGRVEVTSAPTGLDTALLPEMIGTLASQLRSGGGDASIESARKIIFERALYQASCKAAIKAGRIYPEGHIEWLCAELMKNPEITYCPHGRPVAIEMTKSMLDRRFERT